MKRMISAQLATLMVVASAYANSFTTTVGSNRVVVVPPAGVAVASLAAWTAGTLYTNGMMVSMHGRPYMCLTAGYATSTIPTFAKGDLTDNGVVWRPALACDRKGLIIVNEGTTKVYVGDDKAGPGIPIAAGATLNLTDPVLTQGAVYMNVTNAGTGPVNHWSW